MLPKSRAKGAMAAENKFTELFQWTQNKELAIRKILAFHFMMSYFNYVCTPMNTDGLKGNESRIRKILYIPTQDTISVEYLLCPFPFCNWGISIAENPAVAPALNDSMNVPKAMNA